LHDKVPVLRYGHIYESLTNMDLLDQRTKEVRCHTLFLDIAELSQTALPWNRGFRLASCCSEVG